MSAEDELMAAFKRAEDKGLIPPEGCLAPGCRHPSHDLVARLVAAEDVLVALLELDAWNPAHRDEYDHDDPETLAVLEALERWMVYQ